MKIHTASEMPRIAACPPSAALPQHRLPETEFAATGNAVHLYNSHGVIPEDPEALAIGEHIQKAMPPGAWRWEVTFALGADGEGRELGEHLARDYSLAKDGETCGTADAVSIQGGIARILEIKTGWRPVSADGWQTRWLALAAARAHHCDSAEVILLTGHPDGARAEVMQYDAFALDAIEQELANLLARIETETQPTPGDHCRYCPALSECPAAMGIVRSLATIVETMPLTAVDVASAYHIANAARAALVRLEAQLELYATVAPVPLGGGRFWGIRTSDQWKFEAGAPATLRTLLGPVAEKAIGVSVSSTSLAKAVGRDEAKRLTVLLEKQGLATRKQVARLAEYSEKSGD